MKIILTNSSGDIDITNFAVNPTWSGDYTQCARSFEFGLLSSESDKNIPQIWSDLGHLVRLYEGEELLFYGYIFSRQRSTDGNTIDIKCRDRGIYLKKNQGVYNFTGITPEDITQKICADFGIKVLSLAKTSISVSRVFLGATLYDIIMTAYTEASKVNGKKYGLIFRGDALEVFEKTVTSSSLIFSGESNLISASYSESIENMVNRVTIYNKDDKFVKNLDSKDLINLYGVMQAYVKQTKDDNKEYDAQKTLRDKGIERKVTIENIGDTRCITGESVIVKEPYTGLDGSFFIDSDTHTWKNGLYFNKLTLNFDSIMDEKQVGSLPKKNEKKGKK
jgi:hypothetical protein